MSSPIRKIREYEQSLKEIRNNYLRFRGQHGDGSSPILFDSRHVSIPPIWIYWLIAGIILAMLIIGSILQGD